MSNIISPRGVAAAANSAAIGKNNVNSNGISDYEFLQFNQDTRKIHDHEIASFNLLIFTILLIFVILTIWLFKYKRFPYIHETGLAIFYGAVFGAILRYGFTPSNKKTIQLNVNSTSNLTFNINDLADYVHLKYENISQTFIYTYKGPLKGVAQQDYEEKATFDPEVFFNILLPPIIFHAGYSMKRRHFFKNFGAILAFAFVGTSISAFSIGGIMYTMISMFGSIKSYFSFTDCLFFGALVSATDPVTVLAIFNDQRVDVNLYALVFGESVLNDAVSIVLAQTIEKYSVMGNGDGFNGLSLLKCIGDFLIVFFGAFGIGTLMGCITALLTKFTRIREHHLLETSLFILMSYTTFLSSEAAGLTGIVAVLFCGIVQAHYTFNNLSKESQEQTKGIFNVLNFLSENFIFVYIGITMFTFRYHQWEAPFIITGFIAIAIARALNIYPISYLLNLTRTNQIKMNMQHMMFFSGLRGAMAFALAIRNTSTKSRQLILTTTSIIVIVTVIFCGGLTNKMLAWLNIKTGVKEQYVRGNSFVKQNPEDGPDGQAISEQQNETRLQKMFKTNYVFRAWHGFDKNYMKPFFTNSQPTLIQTMPRYLLPIARLLTTKEQYAGGDPISVNRYSLIREDAIQQQQQQHEQNNNNTSSSDKDDNLLIQMETVDI